MRARGIFFLLAYGGSRPTTAESFIEVPHNQSAYSSVLLVAVLAALGVWAVAFTPPSAVSGSVVQPNVGRAVDARRVRSGQFVPGRLMVKWRAGSTRSAQQVALKQVRAQRVVALPLDRTQLVILRKGDSTSAAQRLLARSAAVDYAELDLKRSSRVATAPPGTPTRYTEQWGLNNTGQNVRERAGTDNADINAPEAWGLMTQAVGGDPATKVAVVDSGVDIEHPALQGNLGSGGRDFVDNDTDPSERIDGHGTHVSGIIAARSELAPISGVAWRANIVPIRALDSDGTGSASGVIRSLAYAGDIGSRVVNVSLGSPYWSLSERRVIAKHPRTLYVAAADNGGRDGSGDNSDRVPDYPCSYDLPNLICVGASTSSDARASFSNFGPASVDLAAPGQDIISTWPGGAIDEDFATEVVGSDAATQWVSSKSAHPKLGGSGGNNWVWEGPGEAQQTLIQRAPYANRSNASSTTPPINLAGRSRCVLTFFAAFELEQEFDFVQVKMATDSNGSFSLIDGDSRLTGSDSSVFATAIPAKFVRSDSRVRFTLLSDGSDNDGFAAIDDVRVYCRDGQGAARGDYTNAYKYESGTSMATPHVTGAAALIFSQNPDATPAYVKRALLQGASSTVSFGNTPFRHGRLDVAGAMQSASAGDAASPATLTRPSAGAQIADRTPQLVFKTSGDTSSVSAWHLVIDGRRVKSLSPSAVRAAGYRITAPRLANGYHTWRITADTPTGPLLSEQRTMRMGFSPSVRLSITKASGEVRKCGGTLADACEIPSNVQYVSGTLSASGYASGSQVMVRAYRKGSSTYSRRAVRSYTTFAADGSFPDNSASLRMRLGSGTYRVRADFVGTDIAAASKSPYRYLIVS